MKIPFISIIIPIYNAEKTLFECLNSIQNLDYKKYEVILVDDNSKDNSLEITKKFQFKTISLKKNVGAAETRNIGAKKAKGELLLFTDSDIILPKDTLKKAINYYKKGNNIFNGFFFTKIRFKNLFSQYKHLYLCYYYLKQDKQLHTLDTSLTVIKKIIFKKYNGFNKDIRISEDAEFGTRLTRNGEIITQPKDINMEHIKYYSFKNFIKTDFIRGKKFSKLFLNSIFKDKKQESKNQQEVKSFFLNPLSLYLSVGIMPFIILFAILAIISKNIIFFSIFLAFFLLFILFNLEFWDYLRKQNGFIFAFKSFFVTLLDMTVFDIGIFTTFLNFLIYGKRFVYIEEK